MLEAPKRILLAGLFHETNTFVETPTSLQDFQVARDGELFSRQGDDSPMDGFLATAQEFGWEVIPAVDYRATPSGPVNQEVFETFWTELRPRVESALAHGLDAIFLILHGAMATTKHPDVEGELLERIRQIPGAETLPIFAVLDLHANVSERMAQHATALIPYRENPHIDARETAVRATRVLQRTLTGDMLPQTWYRHSRILLAPPHTGTSEPLMKSLEQLARTLETTHGHEEIGIAAGFAHADTPDTGLTFWVLSHQPENACSEALALLVDEAHALLPSLRQETWSVEAALDEITKARQFPALLVEPSDNIGGGAPGDATFLLRALIKNPIGKTGVILNDPEAVEILQTISIGDSIRFDLGGKGSRMDLGPVELEVTLVSRSDGHFDLEDKQSHLASMGGSKIAMGPCAVVRQGDLTILLTSIKTPPFDLGQWRSQGINPEEFEVITVKAAIGHRRAYDPISASSFLVNTPGPCSSDLFSLPYRNLTRPIIPLDQR